MELEFFRAEHAALLDLRDRFVASMIAGDAGLTVQLRRRLSRLLAAHLVKEDAHLYPCLEHSGDPQTEALALRYAEELGSVGPHWQALMAQWPDERVQAELGDFAELVKPGLEALTRRIEREESELYPLYEAHLQAWLDGPPIAA